MKIEVKHIHKRYKKKVLFKDLSFSISSNGLYILKGPNGIGKSTLLNIISFDDLNFKGKIFLNEKQLRRKDISNYKESIISYSHQVNYFIQEETVKTNLNFLFNESYNDKIKEILNLLYDENIETNIYGELSDGEKNRLNIACTLIKNSPIMIFDETFNYLDHKLAIKILSYLKKIKDEHLIIFSTHEKLSDLFLEEFQVIDLEEIINSKNKIYNFSYFNEKKPENTEIKQKESKSLIKKLLKENRLTLIFGAIFNFIFTICYVIFASFSSIDLDKTINYANNKFIYSNYSIAHYSSYQDFDNSIYSGRFYYTNKILDNVPSLVYSPLFYSYSEISYEIIYGKSPVNEQEIVISSLNYEKLIENNIISNFEDLKELSIIDNQKIVGVYKSDITKGPKKIIDFFLKNNQEIQFNNPMITYMSYSSFSVVSKETAKQIFSKEPNNFYIILNKIEFQDIENKEAPLVFVFNNKGEIMRMDKLIIKINLIGTMVSNIILVFIIIINLLVINLIYIYSHKILSINKVNGVSTSKIIKTLLSLFSFIVTPTLVAFIAGNLLSDTINSIFISSTYITNSVNLFDFNVVEVSIIPALLVLYGILLFMRFKKQLSKNIFTIYKEHKKIS